jgi:alkylation response protein AidB-like acyl-CoA dehydrogenase
VFVIFVAMHFSEAEIEQVQSNSLKAEAAGQLTKDQREVIYKGELYKSLLPEEVGGKDLSLVEAAEVFRECSAIDGSFGWSVTIGVGGNFFYEFMQANVVKEVFSPKDTLIAGSGIPSGTATPEGDGFRINGEWKYCSGAPHATAFTFNCVLIDEAGKKTDRIKSFVLQPEQVQIGEDWNAMGLEATSSHTVKVKDAFVAIDRIFDISQPQGNSENLFFRYPFLEFARVSFATVVLGLGESFLEKSQKLAEENKTHWQQPFPDRYPKVKRLLEEQQKVLEEIHADFFKTIEESWNELEREGSVSVKTAKAVSERCFRTVEEVQQRTSKVFPWLGMSVLFPENELNRIWRDLQTAGQHLLLREL